MRLILGGVNGEYLLDVMLAAEDETEGVTAAVAYATNSRLLFDWCWDKKIPLTFYGRLDPDIAVSIPILERFLKRVHNPAFRCLLVEHHHAKVIWWHGHGLYIGSANLTDKAWYKNVEAGCFFLESEITDEMATDIQGMFGRLEVEGTNLSDELLAAMKARLPFAGGSRNGEDNFWASPSLRRWDGLVTTTSRKAAGQQRRQAFLDEWNATIQLIRRIGQEVSQEINRPGWVSVDAPVGAQADQFLHAYYYQRIVRSGKAYYKEAHEANKGNAEVALKDAIAWWRKLPESKHEATMLNVTAPALRTALTTENLQAMDLHAFTDMMLSVHAVREYARRVNRARIGLSSGRHGVDESVVALARTIWNTNGSDGVQVKSMLGYVLYGGSLDELPARLWDAVSEPRWKIEYMGVSALGEIAGWALPDKFPPRNGRTSKAVRALGYDVTVHV